MNLKLQIVALWSHMATQICLDIGLSNGLVNYGTKPLS